MVLVQKEDYIGRLSVTPKYKTDEPIFKHITGGSISVTMAAWEAEYCLIAGMHGVDPIIKDSDA